MKVIGWPLDLIGVSAVILWRRLSNFKDISQLLKLISRLRVLARFPLVKRGPDVVTEAPLAAKVFSSLIIFFIDEDANLDENNSCDFMSFLMSRCHF